MLSPPPLPRTLEASFRDIGSQRPEVRASAIVDLVRHARDDGSVRDRATAVLEDRLGDSDPRVRSAACVALADLSATDAVPALVRTLSDDDAHVRQMAINALGELRDPRALPPLRRALSDRRAEVRYQGIIAFARVCTDDAAVDQALLDATNDDDDAIVHIALRLAEERLDAALAASQRQPSARVTDPRLIARARALLESESASVALVSAIFLAKAGEKTGLPRLLSVVRGERLAGIDKEEEQAAVELVGELGLTETIPHLERRAWGLTRLVRDTCTFHAKIALARLGHPRAVREILRDLDAVRPAVRASAVVSAGRARLLAARETIARLTEASVDPELVAEALRLLDAPQEPIGASDSTKDPTSGTDGA